MLGEFQQWVVFDFGGNPKLVKKLQIRVVDVLDKNESEISQSDSLLRGQDWDWSQYKVVPFTNRAGERYWPSETNTKPKYSEIPTKPLSKGYYKEFMLSLLDAEENHRLDLLKR